MRSSVDVLIVGGGVIGQATAFWLLSSAPGLAVAVLERDPTYAEASSGLSLGGIRQQFGIPLNIEIAKASVAFYRAVKEHLGPQAEIGFRQHGYLFLGDAASFQALRRRAAAARELGVPVEERTADEIALMVPGIRTDDLAGGTFCPTDGYLDPASVLAAFRRAATALGARQVTGEAVDFLRQGALVRAAELAGGGRIACDRLVVAAGGASGEVARRLGADLPVRRLRRQVHLVAPRAPLPETIPLTIDPSGLHFRPETGGRLLIAHRTRGDGYDLPLTWDRSAFFDELWEPLAARLPALRELRLERGWAGYYDENTVDHNAIVGRLPGTQNAYTATGFSGHGLMQCPSVTRGLSELLLRGRYESLDLSPLGPDRFQAGRLVIEPAVI